MSDSRFSISKTVKSNPPISGLLFKRMKEKILGKNYSLSVAFVGPSRSKALNSSYRKKNYPTDILSFPIGKNEGEIVIDIKTSEKKSKEFGRNLKNYLYFLFIHGLVHLKGYDHGSKMESIEKRFRRYFEI